MGPINPYPWIFGTVTERNFRKNQKHENINKTMQRFALDIRPEKRARWRFRVLDFSRIHGYGPYGLRCFVFGFYYAQKSVHP